MSHTPGPWAVHYDHENVTVYQEAIRKDLGSIAVITSFDDVDDARLIAAAPDLLQLLIDIEAHLYTGAALYSGSLIFKEDAPAHDVIVSAIAKAKGKA